MSFTLYILYIVLSKVRIWKNITHPSDNERAKTFILALHKYEAKLDANQVAGFLIRELGWATDAAQEIAKLIATLNEGKFFKGGERTGLQHHYKRWQEECQNGVADDE